MKESFVLFHSYFEILHDLADDEMGQLLRVIFTYEISGAEPQLDGALKMAFKFIKGDLDRNRIKYEQTVERNRINGAKGGRPRAIPEDTGNPVGYLGTQQNPDEPKKAVYDDVDVSDDDYVSDDALTMSLNKVSVDGNVVDTLSEGNGPEGPKRDHLPYEDIVGIFNSTCKSLPKVKALSASRKKSIKARFRDGYTLDDFKILFSMAEKSQFLTGKVKDFRASFDWLISPTYMPKVLEGTYSSTPTAAGPDFTSADQYQNLSMD